MCEIIKKTNKKIKQSKNKNEHQQQKVEQLLLEQQCSFYRPLINEFCDHWYWNPNDKSNAVLINESNNRVAYFHIGWSSGTDAVRVNKPINLYKNIKYYWEIMLKNKVFGTSMMIGLTTPRARLHSNSYINLIGENKFGWALSHKGLLWHNGQWKEYTKPFLENCTTSIGCLYDGSMGTLTYYKDGQCLGPAFSGLNLVEENLYPTVSSTAAGSQFILTIVRRQYFDLQDRCRDILNRTYNNFQNQSKNFWQQILPEKILSYLLFDDEYLEMKRKNQYSILMKKGKRRFLINNNINYNYLTYHPYQQQLILLTQQHQEQSDDYDNLSD